jgi:circadian clock protein KaiC
MIVYTKQPLEMIFPVSSDRIRTGIQGLDERVQGGFLKGTITALAGASGAGKTTFGLQFIAGGAIEGQTGIFCSLEESPAELRRVGQSLGYDMTDLEKKGLHLISWMPENQSPDAFIFELASQIEAFKPSRIVIDGLSAFKHLYNPEMYLIAKRLANLTRTHNATSIFTILTNQQSGLNVTSVGLSSIFHSIILLRYVEAEAKLKRSLLILKMRASVHDQSILQFSIVEKKGIKILGTMTEYAGILGGIAQTTNRRHLDRERKRQSKEKTVTQKRKTKNEIRQKQIHAKDNSAKLERRRK